MDRTKQTRGRAKSDKLKPNLLNCEVRPGEAGDALALHTDLVLSLRGEVLPPSSAVTTLIPIITVF